MFAKMVAFVLMGIGAVIVLGIIAVAFPHNIHHTAFTAGEYIISWFKVVGACLGGLVCYLTSKV